MTGSRTSTASRFDADRSPSKIKNWSWTSTGSNFTSEASIVGKIPKRGMIDGQWFADLHSLPERRSNVTASFATPAARVEIDLQRLAEDPGSYHLFMARACPFAHRVMMMLALAPTAKIPATYCDPWLGGPDGWTFLPGSDPPVDAHALWQVYASSDPSYSGRVTVPVLWDCNASMIASAESFDIIRAIATTHAPAMCPDSESFDTLCRWLNEELNIGVYKVGFSTDQQSYDKAVADLDTVLDQLAGRVSSSFAFGKTPTIADLMIFATGIRFDPAYHGAFQILHRFWGDSNDLQQHLERISALSGISETVSFDDYRVHYFDEAAFPVRHRMDNGRYILPRTRDPRNVLLQSLGH